MCVEFQQYFTKLYEACNGFGMTVDFTYLSGMPHLSAWDAEFCEMPITAKDIQNEMKACTREKSLGCDGLPFELYFHMLDLFSGLSEDTYHNWQQNRKISSTMSRGVKTPEKGGQN